MATIPLYCSNCGVQNEPDHTYCYSCGRPLRRSNLNSIPLSSDAVTGKMPPGTLLRQRYRVLQTIGRGGMGAVYAAQDTQLGDRIVAVKEMSQSNLAPDEVGRAIEGFQREAHILARLQHPNLPSIHDHFEQDGRWYFVMSFIQGETLREYLKRKGGHLPVDEVLRIGIELCSVLDFLHSHEPQIIFRDLKPSNIMLTPRGQLYLIDFGIVRHFKPGQIRDTVYFRSEGYAPPEQYGEAQTSVRSDIYSLGATLHQMLSGHDPTSTPLRFPDPRIQNPAIPLALVALIMQMLELHEKDRPSSMAEVKQRLEQVARSLQAAQTTYPENNANTANNPNTVPISSSKPGQLSGPQSAASSGQAMLTAMRSSTGTVAALQSLLGTVRHGFAQIKSQTMQRLPPALVQSVQQQFTSIFSSRPNRIFLWTCFIVVAIFTFITTSWVRSGSSSDFETIISLGLAIVGVIFLAAEIAINQKRTVNVVGGFLLMLLAELLFSVLVSNPFSFFYRYVSSCDCDTFNLFSLSGDMLFLTSVLSFILGAIFLCRYAKATMGAIWGGLLTIIGVGLLLFLHYSPFLGLSLCVGLANLILGITIFNTTRKREGA